MTLVLAYAVPAVGETPAVDSVILYDAAGNALPETGDTNTMIPFAVLIAAGAVAMAWRKKHSKNNPLDV